VKKIFDLIELKSIIAQEKRRQKKIILCHGVFDLIHIGHVRHFESAKKLGDILIVSITDDSFINKGPKRPIFSSKFRSELISSFSAVDYVVISKKVDACEVIKNLKPNIYCKGIEYKENNKDITRNILKEVREVKSVGGTIKYTRDITFSSSNLINNYTNNFTDKQKNNLKNISNYGLQKVYQQFLKVKKLKVLVIGEAIIDNYHYCTAMGKSGKEPLLVFKNHDEHMYLGGSLAVAQNISDFCSEIKILTYLGNKKEYLNFIRKKLSKNIILNYIKKKNGSTIVKKRYFDELNKIKLFAIYDLNDDFLDKNEENQFLKLVNKNISNYDLVIVSDYSHGLITEKIAKVICSKSNFLSLNAQINASSIGYHSFKKYKKINLLIINESEIRQEFRDKNNDIKFLIKKLSKLNNIKIVVVTQGKDGAVLFNARDNKFYYCPGYCEKVVDKIGAGDSMLSIMSIFTKVKSDLDLTLVLGSIAAANSIMNISNSSFISSKGMLKTLSHMIK
jgi:rfaE bifunctional protein kinase chain/domain/rfaE bifunctional protein nucleotidyltransferase chain/domain